MAKAEKTEEAPTFKYGVADLSEILGIEAASVRVALRKRNIEKAGRSYGWNTKTELDAVAKQLKEASKSAEPKAAATAKATPKATPKSKKAEVAAAA